MTVPLADALCDAVDHLRAASELVRVCRPGGHIGMVNWTPSGFIGRLLKLVSRHAPPTAQRSDG